MTVELLNTGTELLLGSVINTHLRTVAESLFPLGLRVSRQTAVPDGEAIREALIESFARADIVIVTGGLGPTTDDITREIAAELLGYELIHDEEIMRTIEERFERRCLALSARVGRQAMRPKEAIVLSNAHGTAPGLYFAPASPPQAARKSPHLFLLPGPPRELKPMLDDSVLPILHAIVPQGEKEEMRVWRIAGLGESEVEAAVGERLLSLGAELGYCAKAGEVDVRVIGAPEQLAGASEIITREFGEHIVQEGSLEEAVVALLGSAGQTVATAESCTGGSIANRITGVPGASRVFTAGFITYANEAKMRDLGVGADLLAEHGAVSEPTAAAMAEGALKRTGCDHALATTGIAGPGGGSPEKPVGLAFLALASREKATEVHRLFFPTDRETFKDLVTRAALDRLRRRLIAKDGEHPANSL